MLILSNSVKITFEIDKEENGLESLNMISGFLIDKYKYLIGSIAFSRVLVGNNEYQYTVFISLND